MGAKRDGGAALLGVRPTRASARCVLLERSRQGDGREEAALTELLTDAVGHTPQLFFSTERPTRLRKASARDCREHRPIGDANYTRSVRRKEILRRPTADGRHRLPALPRVIMTLGKHRLATLGAGCCDRRTRRTRLRVLGTVVGAARRTSDSTRARLVRHATDAISASARARCAGARAQARWPEPVAVSCIARRPRDGTRAALHERAPARCRTASRTNERETHDEDLHHDEHVLP